ncbi:Vacuolar protein sorting-associated protein 51 homolog (Protein fat-free homolog) [Durusdinium trenchii]|uniref:Vacuolar protein sorting-associated protein 51 homolog (Protein fat-free homolog) n=1 Tax=Durusdinium trenchii TaxID=1381693 RepID=A0ABP0SNU0_9DINO
MEGRRLPERRRVGALLNAYYHIEGTEKKDAPGSTGSDLDRQGFDAKRYFDGMVSSGQLPELVKRANELDAEIKDLDGDMQMLVYENYSKFIRATDVIKQMKFTIEGLDPDLKVLEGNVSRITDHQKKVEDGVSGRAGEIEGLLKQQRICRKLQVLFELPSTLQKCLDRKAYGEAVEAYCCCSGFLRQYRHMPTFQKVLEEVELQMGRIRVALEERLRSPELSVDEAVNSSVTLLDLGEDQVKVVSEYLTGRTATLRRSLSDCFAPSAADAPAVEGELTKDQEELRRPESMALHTACGKATEAYVPPLCDAVEGFQKLLEVRNASGATVDENVLPDFVSARIEDLCERITQLVDQKVPPSRVLVSCIHSVRDSLRRLHSLLPALLTRLFRSFLTRTAMDAMRSLFATACSQMTSELCKLHGECKNLGESSSSGLDDVLEEIAKTEQALIMNGFTALTECQPLQSLLGPDKVWSGLLRQRSGETRMLRPAAMQRLTLAFALVQAVAGRSCSCDCCETSVAREEAALQCSLAQGAPTAPRCESLCAKSAEDHVLEAASLLDTERFCFAECVPASEDATAGAPCYPLAAGAPGPGRRALRAHRLPRPERRAVVAPAKVSLARAGAADSSPTDKLLEDAQKQAAKAKDAAEAVQRASYGGVATVSEAARAEDDARRAAGFAMGVEGQVAQMLAQAKHQAHDEAIATMQEVMPVVQQAARDAAKKEATTGPFSKLEKSQQEQVKATAAAASAGVGWAEAMAGATRVRDAYSRRSQDFAQAAAASEQSAQSLAMEAKEWRQLSGADPTKRAKVQRKAMRLQEEANEALTAAREEDQKAQKYLSIAKSIDDSLPAYSQQAEQGLQAQPGEPSNHGFTHALSLEQFGGVVFIRLGAFFSSFVELCRAYAGETVPSKEVAELDWCGVFALALVRVGRHLEVKAINKVWGVAKDLFEGETASSELQPNPTVLKATRHASQLVITHYATMSGQRLAHFFRNSVQSRNWMTARCGRGGVLARRKGWGGPKTKAKRGSAKGTC